jgi:hypothetical protein
VSDLRPRPEYGEYATPEEQAEAMGIPLGELSPDAPTPPPGTVVPTTNLAPPRPEDAVPLPPPTGVRAPAAPTQRRWDSTLSLTLVFFGVYLVGSTFLSLRDLGQSMRQSADELGYGDFTSIDLANTLGFWLSIIHPVILVITIGITIVRLRRGKLAFFVPIIGGALAGVLFFVAVLILFFSDPALAAYLQSRQ